MYYAITATFLALTIFVPSFIGLRARSNANWRRMYESQNN